MRPPRTLRRLIANAAPVATSSVSTPTATAMISEFHICSQKWFEVVVLLAEHDLEIVQRRVVGPQLARRSPDSLGEIANRNRW